ncbi:MAG: hypothetical protein COA36_06975 [Desulfotalea sp.]|nr:MAG: hypothetical protein COA36_06975 [Desulfotalea sp.]
MDNLYISISLRKQRLFRLEVISFSLILFFVFFCTTTSSFADSTEIAPERDISVVHDAPQSPDWKILWDRARTLVREGQYLLAADVYEQISSIKPNVEEANWEYCKVLLRTKSYQVASRIIALLLEKNPGKGEYLLVAGQVAAYQKNYAEAERYFGLIFEKSPVGKNGDAALEGFAYSLRSRGHRELAFPLMQQLIVRQPDNETFIHDLAVDAVLLKRFAVARTLYRKLLAHKQVDDRVVFEAATVFFGKDFVKERYVILERYLKLHPDYLPFRKQIMEIDEEAGDYVSLMDHLSFLIKNAANKSSFLLKAADIAANYLKRPDKALGYLEKFRTLNPGNTEVLASINDLQIQLAGDFLSIVENGGADLLWDDLDSIGANRRFIFERMAVLLEKQNKRLPLIDVLEVLCKHASVQNKTVLRLAKLFSTVKKYAKSQYYIALVPAGFRDRNYYLLKADNAIHLGLEFDSFISLRKALDLKPEDLRLRKRCITLAGGLGLIEEQNSLFNYLAKGESSSIPVGLIALHVRLLASNGMYQKALFLCDRYIGVATSDNVFLQLYLVKTDVLRQSGRLRHAEQLLRQLLNDRRYQNIVLLQLVENAIADRRLLMARKWLDLWAQDTRPRAGESAVTRPQLQQRIRLAKIRLLRFEGQTYEAFELVDQSFIEAQNRDKSLTDLAFISSLNKEKCQLYLVTGNYLAAEKIVTSQLKQNSFDPEIYILDQEITLHLGGEDVQTAAIDQLMRAGSLLFTRVMSLVEKEIERHSYVSARQHFSLIAHGLDRSIRLKNLGIKLALADGKLEPVKNDLLWLEDRFDKEDSFCKLHIEIMSKIGRYSEALERYKQCFQGQLTATNISADRQNIVVEDDLLYGRLLWGAKQYEDALAVYKKLLDPPVYQQLIKQFRAKKINYQYLTRHQTFWNRMMLLLETEPEIIAELMEPTFLFDNRGNATGKIVADNYEQYSWQKIIENEYLARKSIYNRKYHFAAKSYEKLLEKEETTESKVDLATIYGRIGKFRKEAQVYEDITNIGEVTPELRESIKRNILQIRPTNTVDIVVEERSGRQGKVDIRTTSLGSSFWFTPELNKDFWLSYAYKQYESTDRKGEIDSNILRGAMTYEYSRNYELVTGIGVEKLNDSAGGEVQYNLQLKGQLDDYVSGYVLYAKAPVDDTVEAIEEGIYRQFLQTGLTIETELGVTFGGDVQYSLYSDNNEQNRFYWFSSYSFFGDSLQLDVRYAYQYLRNKDINGSENDFNGGHSDDFVQIYWSPDSYSEHRIGLQLKKDFFGYLTDVENKISYFRIDTGISLENEENIAYSARFDIFLEMSPHLLLKGNFSFNSSDEYHEKMLALSLHYSW